MAEAQLLSADARAQERFQRISDPFHLLHFTVFHLSKVQDLSVRRTNLQQRTEREAGCELTPPSLPQQAEGRRGGQGQPCSAHHAVPAAHRPRLRLQLPTEELAEVSVVVQILHSCLLHVDPEGPDVEAVDGLPQPGGQLHLVQAPPGSREQASGNRFVECNLRRDEGHRGPRGCLRMALPFPLDQEGSSYSPEFKGLHQAQSSLQISSNAALCPPSILMLTVKDRMKLAITSD